jgi:hypothetical protein
LVRTIRELRNAILVAQDKTSHEGLQRPIIDETNLEGTYDLEVHGNARTTEEFLVMLRDQLGLILPEHRNIEMPAIRLLG